MPRIRGLLSASISTLRLVVVDQDGSCGVGEHGPFVTSEAIFVVEERAEGDTAVVLGRVPGVPIVEADCRVRGVVGDFG